MSSAVLKIRKLSPTLTKKTDNNFIHTAKAARKKERKTSEDLGQKPVVLFDVNNKLMSSEQMKLKEIENEGKSIIGSREENEGKKSRGKEEREKKGDADCIDKSRRLSSKKRSLKKSKSLKHKTNSSVSQNKINDPEITLIESNKCSVKYASKLDQNKEFRDYMEDFISINSPFGYEIKDNFRHLFCVFDGHGGDETAKLCVRKYPEILEKCLVNISNPMEIEHALNKSFKLMNKEIEKLNHPSTGNTATVLLLLHKILFCANVGDSSCVLVSEKKAEKISFDHKCSVPEEAKRIQKHKGNLYEGRLGGVLAISRTLGDLDLVPDGVTCEPHVSKMLVESDMNYCILGSDGVWDVISLEEVYDICYRYCDCNLIAEQIVEDAIFNGSQDNISVIVVELNKPFKLRKRTMG